MSNKLQIADATPWKDHFRQHTLRVGFQIQLTKSMLEMLCAVSDDVTWDRAMFPGQHCPDNWVATLASLVKRGLIATKTDSEIARERRDKNHSRSRADSSYEWSNYKLTPAGVHVVELIKLAGMFVTADAAISKKSRRA